MYKILIIFAFFTYSSCQDDNCRCGYKYISKDSQLDERIREQRHLVNMVKYEKQGPRRWLHHEALNFTWPDYIYDNIPENFYGYNDEFTNVTSPKNAVKLESRLSIGGTDEAKETGINEFPMMAAIYMGSKANDGRLYAGGVIISKRFVLTAAHVLHTLDLPQTTVAVGEHHREEDLSPDFQEIKAINFIEHQSYDSSSFDYDIGLIELEKEITFTDRVGPACLPFKYIDKDFTGLYGTYLGWGPQIPNGPPSNFLRKVDVQVIAEDECRNKHPKITPRHLCAFAPGKDACDQDSGGPLLYTDPDTTRLYVIGIISFGRFCVTDDPGVNIRVTTLLDWIREKAPDVYCGQP